MPINLKALDKRANEFNNRYHTHFSYSGFYSKCKTFARLEPKRAADVVYKGTLGTLLKEVLITACDRERVAKDTSKCAVDLQAVVNDFEEYLMIPFIKECKQAGEKPYPKHYGGMTEEQRIELVEHVVNASPKNDVELTEMAYKKGQIRIRDLREIVGDMNFTDGVKDSQLHRIGTFMIALENVNNSRSFWWRLNPLNWGRNNAEKREAKEFKTLLSSFGNNALERAKTLALREYKTIELTRESINNSKAELESAKKENVVESDKERNVIKIEIDNEIKTEVSNKIDTSKKEHDQPVKGKN